MSDTLTSRLQQTRLMVVEVDRPRGHLRVRGEACRDLSCHTHTVVILDDGRESDLDALHPGDIVRNDMRPDDGHLVARVVVLRRVWESLASPEH